MRKLRILPIIFLLIFANCGGFNFSTSLRAVLAASGPLIESLNLGDKKTAVVADFADLASAAGTLGDEIKACTDKPCQLNAVDRFQTRFWDIERRGHFKLSPKLEKVQEVLAGLIASARIFYGAKPPAVRGSSGRVVTEGDLKAQLDELKVAMKP